MNGLGEKLKTARHAKHWTQQKVAESLHMQRPTYAKWETDRAEPPLSALCQLRRLLDIPAELLLEWEE